MHLTLFRASRHRVEVFETAGRRAMAGQLSARRGEAMGAR
jgi:hypothetical protein